jgi:uncharacterized protein YuzB (UPF0349 family)
MKIKICEKFSKINKLQKKLIEVFPDEEIIVKKCINMCKICEHKPVAKVDDKKFKASRISKLIEKIEAEF